MKKLTKIAMICGLFLGAMVMVSPAFGQGEAAPANNTEKVTVSSDTEAAPAAKHACKPGCEMACCAGKVSATSGNAGAKKACTGASASKKACTGSAAKKSCSHAKTASVGGNVTETSADAGAAKSAHGCKPGCAMACCAGKVSATSGNAGAKKSCAGHAAKKSCSHSKKSAAVTQ